MLVRNSLLITHIFKVAAVHLTVSNLIILCFVPCRAPALQLETTLATPQTDCSGSLWRSPTSSGTLKSFWWDQMGSLWWGGTQVSTFLMSELTFADISSNYTQRIYLISSDWSFSFHEVTGVKVASNVKKKKKVMSTVCDPWWWHVEWKRGLKTVTLWCLFGFWGSGKLFSAFRLPCKPSVMSSSHFRTCWPLQPKCKLLSINHGKHWRAAHSLPETTVLLWVSWKGEQNVVFVALYFYPAIKNGQNVNTNEQGEVLINT